MGCHTWCHLLVQESITVSVELRKYPFRCFRCCRAQCHSEMRGSCCVAVVLATAVVLLVDAASLPHVDYVRKFNTDGPLPLLQPEGSDLPEQIKLSYIGDDSLKLSFLGPKSVDDAQAPLT